MICVGVSHSHCGNAVCMMQGAFFFGSAMQSHAAGHGVDASTGSAYRTPSAELQHSPNLSAMPGQGGAVEFDLEKVRDES
jgi:hypothetical protein